MEETEGKTLCPQSHGVDDAGHHLDSTSTYFGLGHMCHKHNKLFTMEHVQECSEIRGCDNIQSYARRLKEQHILEWSSEERLQAITEFALLTIQMKYLESTNQGSLVQTQPPA